MMFPKQTINSAVAGLVQKGWLELQPLPDSRSRKQLLLTPDGEELARNTVKKMRKAEERAVKTLGQEKMEQYIALHDEFLAQLQMRFEKKGIISNLKTKKI